jgi:hypothetical protein
MITTIREPDYVRNKVDGSVTIRELLGYAQLNVDTWLADPVLWDLTNGTLAEDSSDYLAVRGVVSNIHDLAEKRRGRKTAFLAPDPLSYGMLRMAITIVDSIESRLVAQVFTEKSAAQAWLKQG